MSSSTRSTFYSTLYIVQTFRELICISEVTFVLTQIYDLKIIIKKIAETCLVFI